MYPACITYVEDGQLHQQTWDGQSIIKTRDSPIMMDSPIQQDTVDVENLSI